MKKRSLWKDIKKCFSKSKGRFISIVSLIALGSFALVGLQITGPDMRQTGTAYFEALNVADITIIGDYGIDENNEEAISQVSGASAIEYGYLKDVTIKNTLTSVRIFSATETLSQYELTEGKMPTDSEEIALASFLADEYSIGQEITFEEKADASGETVLKHHTFSIVGFVNSGEILSSINMGNSTAGTGELQGYGVVTADAFDSEVYMIARLSFADTAGVDPYSDEYTDLIQAHKDELDLLLADQPAVRLATIKAEYQEKIDDGQQEVDDAKQELADAEQELADGRQELDDAYAEVSAAQGELDSAVADAQAQIDDGTVQISDAEAEIDNGQSQLDSAAAAIASGQEQLVQGKEQLAAKQAELDAAKQQLAEGESSYSQQSTLLSQKQQEYDEKYAEFSSGQQALEDAQNQLDASQMEIDQNRTDLEDGKAQYESGIQALTKSIDAMESAAELSEEQQAHLEALRQQLTETEQAREAFIAGTYTPGIVQLDAAQEVLAEKAAVLEERRTALQAAEAELSEAKAQLDAGWSALADAGEQLEQARQQAASGEAQIAAAQQTLAASAQTLSEKTSEYNSAAAELDEAKKTLNEKKQELEDAKEELAAKQADGARQIADAEAEIAEKEQEYQDALAEYNEKKPDADAEIADAEAELDDARETLDTLSLPVYALDTRREIPGAEGYTIYSSVTNIVDALADVFPIFLYFVAALVTLTTMTRFVDEERMNAGTLKALGYDNRDIIKKFTVYGWTASFTGTVMGIAAGHVLIPKIVYSAYGKSFTYPEIELHFYPGITVLALVLAFLSAVVPAYLVAARQLQEKPAALLQPKPPAAGSKILLERITPVWNRMSFTHKVTARNIFRYKKRMLMTIFGVAGAVTLLFAGFSVQHSISGVNDRQFGEILQYDLIVAQNDNLTEDETAELESLLTSDGVAQQMPIVYEEVTKVAGDNRDKQTIKLIAPADEETFRQYISLNDRKSGEAISLPGEGAVLSERLAKLLDVQPGDTITVTDENNAEWELQVAAVTEMYTGHFIFLSAEYYETVFETDYTPNANLVTLTNRSLDNASLQASRFVALDAVKGVVQNTTLINQINTIVNSLNKIMDVLILVAILLAVVILYNLTNINVSERIRELSTIKVLGFYDKEVTLYIYRETILLTVLGVLAGFGLGDLLYLYILNVVPPDEVMFNPALGAKAFLVPALLVGVITAILGFVIHRRLKNVDMLEALKSVD